ncbi:MAG TPA: M56 family metallopeptidase [Terriglobales bacterium]|nr:M56 family metallopeptidase [Terriglobales bacterium]
MTHLTSWLTPDFLRPLGLALLHFIWQGAALAALAALAMAITRRASVRYVIAVAMLALMVGAPIITFSVLCYRSAALPREVPSPAVDIPSVSTTASSSVLASRSPQTPADRQDAILWLVEAWFLGVLLFSLRTAGGIVLLDRLRRRNTVPADEPLLSRCLALQHRMGITRLIRYCESLELEAPAVIGWFRPVVLLPVSALTGLTEDQLQAVIAHELAHIRRFDAFVNLFQVAAESLFFYHPAVWWLNRRIRAERENCCDDSAIAVCGNPLEYARALTLLEERRVAPILAMAANRNPLAARIHRLIGAPSLNSGLRTAGLAAGLFCLSAAVLAGNAFFGIARSASAAQTTPSPNPTPSPTRSSVIVVEAPRPSPEESSSAKSLSHAHATPKPDADADPAPQSQPSPQEAPSPEKQSYIDSLKAEGLDNLTADQLISLKVQGITAQYVHEIRAEGFKPSVDDLIGMKVQGITPDYIREMKAAGLTLNVDELVGMKVQGVTPEYMQKMHDLGLKTDPDNLIGMKVQGITPEYVQEMRATGLKIDSDDLIGMKVQGITPAYVKELQDLGLKPDSDSAIGMKVQGITPDYVRAIFATGLKPDADDLIGLKVQGVTPEYVKALQSQGFKVDVDDCIGAKVQGVTPEFIEKAKSHGFKDLTLEKLIELKHAGVLD